MSSKQNSRRDSSAGALIDLSPEVIAERVKRLGVVRRTAKAALRQRISIAEKDGRTKS